MIALPLAVALAACGSGGSEGGGAKQALKVVGSSTVYPFTTAVAEQFQRDNPNVSVVVESTGTGAGMKLFCGGVGAIGAPLREWGIYRSWAQLVAVSGMAAVTHDSRGEAAGEDLASLIAHIAEFDARELYLALGYSSTFTYCREVLKLSEHEAYRRIEVARYARKYPMILEKLADL